MAVQGSKYLLSQEGLKFFVSPLCPLPRHLPFALSREGLRESLKDLGWMQRGWELLLGSGTTSFRSLPLQKLEAKIKRLETDCVAICP